MLGRLDREGPASISDLAAADRMRPQSMAQTVRDLEDAGLVSRRPDPQDGRRSFVELTPAGLETLHATRARREDWLTQTLDRELDAERARAAAPGADACSTAWPTPDGAQPRERGDREHERQEAVALSEVATRPSRRERRRGRRR